jgi:hypothetical protein
LINHRFLTLRCMPSYHLNSKFCIQHLTVSLFHYNLTTSSNTLHELWDLILHLKRLLDWLRLSAEMEFPDMKFWSIQIRFYFL